MHGIKHWRDGDAREWSLAMYVTRRLLVLVFGACLLAASSEAQTPQVVFDLDGDGVSMTRTLTARQAAALQAALMRFNQTTRRGEVSLTLDEWVWSWIEDRARLHLGELRETERLSACEKYQTLTTAEQKAIIDKLGASPCVPQ